MLPIPLLAAADHNFRRLLARLRHLPFYGSHEGRLNRFLCLGNPQSGRDRFWMNGLKLWNSTSFPKPLM